MKAMTALSPHVGNVRMRNGRWHSLSFTYQSPHTGGNLASL